MRAQHSSMDMGKSKTPWFFQKHLWFILWKSHTLLPVVFPCSQRQKNQWNHQIKTGSPIYKWNWLQQTPVPIPHTKIDKNQNKLKKLNKINSKSKCIKFLPTQYRSSNSSQVENEMKPCSLPWKLSIRPWIQGNQRLHGFFKNNFDSSPGNHRLCCRSFFPVFALIWPEEYRLPAESYNSNKKHKKLQA